MATESARPLSGGTGAGKWPPSKDTGSYDSIPASLSEDELAELAFMPNSGGIFGKWRGSVLKRSGSAPPTMEGSLVALGHLTGQPSGNLGAILPNLGTEANNSESKENIYYDSACVKYYMSKVNLNPRFPPPLVSRNQFGKSEERKPFSLDDSSSRSLLLGHPTLPTHKEEPEDEKSPSLDSSSADDAQCDSAQSTSNLGGHSPNLVDSIKVIPVLIQELALIVFSTCTQTNFVALFGCGFCSSCTWFLRLWCTAVATSSSCSRSQKNGSRRRLMFSSVT